MALFPLTPEATRYFAGAAAAAARALGLRRAGDVDAAAARLGVRAHRLRAVAALLDGEQAWDAPAAAATGGDWDRLADVIRADRALAADGALPRYHAHLAHAGTDDARALATRMAAWPEATDGLIDLGGGAGAYAAAFVAAAPAARATLVDRADVLALAPRHPRLTTLAGDLFDVALPPHGIALLSNVLHHYAAADAACLVARAAAAARVVVVKELRAGTRAARFFAVNMALYSDGGDVHATARIAEWLAAAGRRDVDIDERGDDVVVVGR